MSEYSATVIWQRNNDEVFTDNKYSRVHQWSFDGGAKISASPSPHIVPVPFSDEAFVDPEEAFIASLSSCHMLFFLSIAAKQSYVVDAYTDQAIGIMAKNELGKISMTTVTLKPSVTFGGDRQPTPEQLEALHHLAHEQCFIANSVTTELAIDIQ